MELGPRTGSETISFRRRPTQKKVIDCTLGRRRKSESAAGRLGAWAVGRLGIWQAGLLGGWEAGLLGARAGLLGPSLWTQPADAEKSEISESRRIG